MQDLSSACRQITASTIWQYRAMAIPYRDGTWNHDVSQNIQALLAAITASPPYRILDLGCGPGRDLSSTAMTMAGTAAARWSARRCSG